MHTHNNDFAAARVLRAVRRPGRPRGRQYDVLYTLRLPRPALEAIRELAKHTDRTVADVLRTGVIASLVQAVAPAAAIAKDENAAPSRRLEAADLLRLVTTAATYLGPLGLKIARAEADAAETNSLAPAQTPTA